ncbi:MAG: hypothetical protein MH472_02435 [Bacteroidia bacterium]|nr:hypothetical protein [Bacteroidia bacterium]
METKFTKNLSILTFLITVLFLNACKFKDPLEGFAISVKTDAISAAHIFRVVDAKTGFSKAQFDNVTVTLSGPGAANLYDADGKKSFKIVEGRIGICIRKGVNPTETNPIVFNMDLNVPGYLSKRLTYSLTSIMPTTNTITLVNENDLPSGASKRDTTFTVPSSGTTNAISINSTSTTSKPEMASVTLPAGTKFTFEDGTPASGNITVNMFHTLTKTEQDFAMASNTPFNNKFKDSTGKEVEYFVNEKEIINLQFLSSGKALNTVFADGIYNPGFFSQPSGPSLLVFLPSRGVSQLPIAISSGYSSPSVGWFQSSYVISCGSISKDFTVTNYSTAGSNYEFRRADFGTSGVFSFPLSVQAIQPSTNGKFTTSLPSLGSTCSIKVQYKKVNETTWTDAPDNGIIVLEVPPPNTFLKVYFGVVCTKGQVERPVLAEGTNIYLIKENTYQSTPNPARGGALIYPEDDAVSGVKWKKYTVIGQETRNNKVWNVINIPWSDLEAGQEYRASYYRASGRVDNNVNDPSGKIFAPAANSFSELEIEMNVADCD